MPHILFVCTANICRSPVGEGLLRHTFQQRGMVGWIVGSAGTCAMAGQQVSAFSVQAMAERGIDISSHCSRAVNEMLLQEADLVLCMEWRHVAALRGEFPDHATKIYTLGQMSGEKGGVADPYGSTLENYRRMVAEVSALLEAGFDQIVTLAGENAARRQTEITNLQ
ncbi:MAG TPA: low molecular weight protein arginine phosphatase [Anaerolineae bacterium]|nr:low molecular weight protein arginine phosphatase [Anaerolineae bacterium]